LGAGTEEKWRKEFLDHKTGTLEAAMKGIWENWGKWYPLKRQIALNNICRCFRPYCCYSLSTVKFGNLRGKNIYLLTESHVCIKEWSERPDVLPVVSEDICLIPTNSDGLHIAHLMW
jgi:hypothetical protein